MIKGPTTHIGDNSFVTSAPQIA